MARIKYTTEHPEFQRLAADVRKRCEESMERIAPKLWGMALLQFAAVPDKNGNIDPLLAPRVQSAFEKMMERAARSFLRRAEKHLGLHGKYVGH